MCGIFGYAGPELPEEKFLRDALDTLTHRGPDQSGVYTDTETELKLWLGHRRLSILDLSEAGRQPFVTPDRKVAVAVNGEIYNYRELRADLKKRGAQFRSDSDSEVLLWGFYHEGETFFGNLRGMYAAAIWDRRGRGPEETRLRFLAKVYSVEDAVFFQGNVENLSDFYRKAEVFLMTSHYEGMPNAMLEAYAHGCPTISFDFDFGASAIITHGKNGLLVPQDDEDAFVNAVITYLKSPEMRQLFVANIPVLLNKFRPDCIVDQWEECIKRTLQEK